MVTEPYDLPAEEHQEQPNSPALIESLVAAFAIRWSCARDGVEMDLVDQFDGSQVTAHVVSVTSLDAPVEPVEFTALPEVGRALRTVIPDLPDLLQESPVAQPLSLILVTLRFEQPLTTLVVDEPTRTVSYSGLSTLVDFILAVGSRALTEWSDGRAAGPICRGNLMGSGILVPEPIAGDRLALPIFQHPDLGCWSPATPAPTQSGDHIYGPVPASVKRLNMWSERFALRRARGEWAEAVVALQAAQEQYLDSIARTLLIDHGWVRTDFEASPDILNNRRKPLAIMQQHLGGNWEKVRDDQDAIWEARNASIHHAGPANEKMLDELIDRTHSLFEHLEIRFSLPAIAKTHPLTCTLLAPEHAVKMLGKEVATFLSRELDRHPLEDVVDLADYLTFPPRAATDKLETCQKDQAAWLHWQTLTEMAS